MTPSAMTQGDTDCCAVRDMAAGLLTGVAEVVGGFEPGPFCTASAALKGGSLGKHLRHVTDHYAAIVVGLKTGEAFDYDRRRRDVPEESDPRAAQQVSRRLAESIASLTPDDLNREVRIRVMLDGEGAEATLSTTAARELFFASHHAIHHFAMMRAIASELGIELDANFGKAPSTVNHERGCTSDAGKPSNS